LAPCRSLYSSYRSISAGVTLARWACVGARFVGWVPGGMLLTGVVCKGGGRGSRSRAGPAAGRAFFRGGRGRAPGGEGGLGGLSCARLDTVRGGR
jgi:hypothetical protein